MPSKKKKAQVAVSVTEGTPSLSLGAGVMAVQRFSAMVDDPALPYVLEFAAVVRAGKYQIDNLHVRRRAEAAERAGITNDSLRAARLADYVTTGALEAARHASLPDSGDELEHAAASYRFAVLVGKPPTNAVAEALGVSRATAGRLIASARESGLLGKAPRGRGGELKKGERRGAR